MGAGQRPQLRKSQRSLRSQVFPDWNKVLFLVADAGRGGGPPFLLSGGVDIRIRKDGLGLLQAIRKLLLEIADYSRVAVEGEKSGKPGNSR